MSLFFSWNFFCFKVVFHAFVDCIVDIVPNLIQALLSYIDEWVLAKMLFDFFSPFFPCLLFDVSYVEYSSGLSFLVFSRACAS